MYTLCFQRVLRALLLTPMLTVGVYAQASHAQSSCDPATLAPKDFAYGSVPFNPKRLFTSLNGENPLNPYSGNNVATLNAEYGFAVGFKVTMHPWHLYNLWIPPHAWLHHIIVKFDMDNNGSWDMVQTLNSENFGGNYNASVSKTWSYSIPTYPTMDSHTIRWAIEEWRVDVNIQEYYYGTTSGTVHIQTMPMPLSFVSNDGDSFVGYISPDNVWDRPLLLVEGLDEGANGANITYPDDYLGRFMNRPNGPGSSLMDALLAGGYDVFAYNYADAGADLRCNAMGVLGAILEIGDLFAPNPNLTRVLGFSMGGVVSRYALAWAEQNGWDHRCDMFISGDAPQQGAWVNYAFQDWLWVNEQNGNGTFAKLASPFKSMAAKQLLVSNRWDPEPFKRDSTKLSDPIEGGPLYEEFFHELNALNGDGYPHLTTNIGVSNTRGDTQQKTIPSLYSEAIVGLKTLVTLTVEDIYVNSVPFGERDIQGGSYQPAFKKSSISEEISMFPGLFIEGIKIADPIDLHVDVNLGEDGPPAFVHAYSALDLRNVVWDTGNNDADIVDWGYSKFDRLYMIPLFEPGDPGTETRRAWHDEFPAHIIPLVIGALLEGPQKSRVYGIVQSIQGPESGLQVRAVNADDAVEAVTGTDDQGSYSLRIPSDWSGEIVVADPYWNAPAPTTYPVSGTGTPGVYEVNFQVSHETSEFCDAVLIDTAAPSYGDLQLHFEGSTVYCAWTQGTGLGDFAYQKLNSSGEMYWQDAKLLAADPAKAETQGRLVTDWTWAGTYAWLQDSPQEVYAACVHADGSSRWGPRRVSLLSGAEPSTVVSVDGHDGSFIFWTDDRGAGTQLFAQKLDDWTGDAFLGWPYEDGVAISLGGVDPAVIGVDYDDGNGAMVTWVDGGTQAVYANQVATDAFLRWTVDGRRASTLAIPQSEPSLYGSYEGPWLAFTVDDPVTGKDIQMQRLDYDGEPFVNWTDDGVRVCSAAGAQEHPQILSSGFGGTCVVWDDSRGGGNVFAQRVGYYGDLQWSANGVDVTAGMGAQPGSFHALLGPSGDIFVGWRDPAGRLRVQRIDIQSGARLWGQGLIVAASMTGNPVLYGDYNGGGIFVAWPNELAPGFSEIRMNYLDYSGELCVPCEDLAITNLSVNPLICDQTTIQWQTTTLSTCTVKVRRSGDPWTVYHLNAATSFSKTIHTSGRKVRYEYEITATATDCGAVATVAGSWNTPKICAITMKGQMPFRTQLKGVAPNPFNPATTVQFELAQSSRVDLKIVDLRGRVVRDLSGEELEPGPHDIVWNGRDDNGGAVASGVYFVLFRADSVEQRQKILLLK